MRISFSLLLNAADRIDATHKPDPLPPDWPDWRIRRARRWLTNAHKPGIDRTGNLWIQRALNLRGERDPNAKPLPASKQLGPGKIHHSSLEAVARGIVAKLTIAACHKAAASPDFLQSARIAKPALLHFLKDAIAQRLVEERREIEERERKRGKRRKGAQLKH